jgi:hypothetical protein
MLTRGTAIFSRIFVVGLVVVGIAACNKDEDAEPEGPPPDKYPSVSAFCGAIAEAQCTEEIVLNCPLPSKDECKAAVQNACVNQNADVTKNQQLVYYKPKKADACVDAIKTAYTDSKVTAAEWTTFRDKCAPVFSAQKGSGFPCTSDIDCDLDADLFCWKSAPGQGTCEKMIPVSGGGSCTAPGSACSETQYCNPTVSACIDIKKNGGDPCDPDVDPCPPGGVGGAVCEDDGSGNRTCQAVHKVSQPCTADEQCETRFCGLIGGNQVCLNTLVIGTGSDVCKNFGAP